MQAKAILAKCSKAVQLFGRLVVMMAAIWGLFGGLPPSSIQAQGPIDENLMEFDFAKGEISYPNAVDQAQVAIKAVEMFRQGTQPAASPFYIKQNFHDDGFIDNWLQLLQTDVDSDTFPPIGCNLFDNHSDDKQYLWGVDQHRALSGQSALWPARAGSNGLIPSLEFYPPNTSSWLDCGPYDFRTAQTLLVRFGMWLDVTDPDDKFTLLVSDDGQRYRGIGWTGEQDWSRQNVLFRGIDSDDVYIAWVFESDEDQNSDEGVWIDDLEIWRYDTPNKQCGNLDTGVKGLHVPTFDPTVMPLAPIFREGDTSALTNVAATRTDWVRLGLFHRDGIIRVRELDRIVDSLCGQGIATLGLINHQSLTRADYNQDIDGSYRAEFADFAAFVTRHYQGRISHWEIWNEPNLNEGNPAPRLEPDAYAELVNLTYDRIKETDENAVVLFGSLASAWNDSFSYFRSVYTYWDANLDGVRPFDIFSIHPYPRPLEGPNPSAYLSTVLDKFRLEMDSRGDTDKKIWVSEIGWNSSKGSPNRPTCVDPVLVTEEEQATFLTSSFDILLNEGTVEKVFWYQFMNTGISTPCTLMGRKSLPSALSSEKPATSDDTFIDWWFGLFEGDKVTPKRAFYAFSQYPLDEQNTVYLPLVIK